MEKLYERSFIDDRRRMESKLSIQFVHGLIDDFSSCSNFFLGKGGRGDEGEVVKKRVNEF